MFRFNSSSHGLCIFDGAFLFGYAYGLGIASLCFHFFINQQIRPRFNIEVSTVYNEVLVDYKKIYKLQIL